MAERLDLLTAEEIAGMRRATRSDWINWESPGFQERVMATLETLMAENERLKERQERFRGYAMDEDPP